MSDMKHGGNVWQGDSPGQWLDFSANLRPEGTPEWVMRAMTEALSDVRFYPDRSMKRARRGLSEYLGVPEACVFPTAGGAAAIDLALSRRTGDVYAYPVTFGEYSERARVHNRNVKIWEGVCSENDTVILCNPNNPTGSAVSKEEMLKTYALVSRMGGELIVDEAFVDFCPEISVRAHVSRGLTVVGSLTKSLAIPGIRLGYICAEPEEMKKFERRALPWALGAMASAVAWHVKDHANDVMEEAARNRERRERFASALEGLGAIVHPSESNFLLVNFQKDMSEAAETLRKRRILVRTCASFGLGPEYWRLAVKTDGENQTLIRELEEILYAR